MTDPNPRTSQTTVVYPRLPGARSADPRSRQVFRRVLDLRSLGFDTTLVPLETRRSGGAPNELRAAGVTLEAGPRESASSRLRRSLGVSELLYLSDLAIPANIVDLALEFPGRLVLDIDRLPSSTRSTALDRMRGGDADGLLTEIEHLVARENVLLERADLIICASKWLHALVANRCGTATVVVPPTTSIGPRRDPRDAMGGRIVLPGRFSDEFATPDETTVERLLSRNDTTDDSDPDAGLLQRFVVVPEDTVPHLRYGIKGRIDVVGLIDSHSTTLDAVTALDIRCYGTPTTARRAELMSAGVPFIASSTAIGPDDDLAELTGYLVADDLPGQFAAIRRLCDDPELWGDISQALQDLASVSRPEVVRESLSDALASTDLTNAGAATTRGTAGTSHVGGSRSSSRPDDEYEVFPVGGTLADADPRIEELESAMIPLRLHDRDTSINLQSTMDPDQRYRVYSRTHLSAPPGTTPPLIPGQDQIHFSILLPTYQTDPELLAECLDSVLAQTHPAWELCIVDDGSTTDDHIDELLRRCANDDRVKLRLNPYNQGIGSATNDALAMATGEWIVLLDHDDVLKPDALAWVAAYIARCPDYDLWYSDEDKIDLDGNLSRPFFKPDYSPDLLMGVNYVCHLLTVRHDLIDRVGGFRTGFDGAQDYDLVLRLVDEARRVGHIAKTLYSWRMIEGSTALDTSSKPQAHHAGRDALVDTLTRRFEPGTVRDGMYDTTHRVSYSVDTTSLLTIMVPIRDRVDLLRACVERLGATTAGVRYELLIIDNQSSDPETLSYLDELIALGHRVVRYPHEFSFARQINLGALHARGDLLLILNNDALALVDDWLIRMMEHAQRPEVGLVGARLMFPPDQRGGRPQHEGIVMGMAGLAYNIDLGGYAGLDQFVRNCSSVTAACVMLRTSVFFAVGGMEERLRVAYNDVDFGLRVSEFGLRVVYTPFALLEHPESASRGALHPMDDEEWLIGRWGPKNAVREPFISPHFEWLMPVFYRL